MVTKERKNRYRGRIVLLIRLGSTDEDVMLAKIDHGVNVGVHSAYESIFCDSIQGYILSPFRNFEKLPMIKADCESQPRSRWHVGRIIKDYENIVGFLKRRGHYGSYLPWKYVLEREAKPFEFLDKLICERLPERDRMKRYMEEASHKHRGP